MRRDEWSFMWPASLLATLCEANLAHHGARLLYYESELEKAKTYLEEHGLKIEVVQHSGGSDVRVDADSIAKEAFTFADGKVRKHKGETEIYGRWLDLFRANPGKAFELDMSDFKFFVGKAGQALAEEYANTPLTSTAL